MLRKMVAGYVIISAILVLAAGQAYPAEKPKLPQALPYPEVDALNSIMNPHNQINDEGEVLWNTCQVCHKNVPDLKKEKNIKDVHLRSEDLNEVCTRCHPYRTHPGAEGIETTMSMITAPDHLVAPSKKIFNNMRLALKETPLLLPVDKTGKIVCSTCHNPHERGLLTGRADYGADSEIRLRSAGLEICQYCHRK
jgi:hypothetical protein